jgi:hypothetical protein
MHCGKTSERIGIKMARPTPVSETGVKVSRRLLGWAYVQIKELCTASKKVIQADQNGHVVQAWIKAVSFVFA